MRFLVKTLLLLLSIDTVICHRHLLPPELMLVKEEGVDAIMEEGEVITRVQFQMKFDGLEGLEASLRSVYEQTCSLVSTPTVRRARRDIGFGEAAGVVAIGIVGTILSPVGAGVGAAVSVMNALRLKELDKKMTDLYAAHMSDKFASELDRAFVSHELSGVLLGGLSKHFIQSTGMSSISEVRARVKIYVDHCQGDAVIAHAVHSDPFNSVRGSVYMVADPGNFLKEEKLYVYHDLPKELFVADNGDAMVTGKCLPSFGNTSLCTKQTEFVAEDACSVYNYESNCPRIIVNMDHKGSHVRRVGENLIIVSTLPHAMLKNSKGKSEKFYLKRGGITIITLKFEEILELDGVQYHGFSEKTEKITIDIKDIAHSLPSGLSYDVEIGKPKMIPSRSELSYTFTITVAVWSGGVIAVISVIALVVYFAYRCRPSM